MHGCSTHAHQAGDRLKSLGKVWICFIEKLYMAVFQCKTYGVLINTVTFSEFFCHIEMCGIISNSPQLQDSECVKW